GVMRPGRARRPRRRRDERFVHVPADQGTPAAGVGIGRQGVEPIHWRDDVLIDPAVERGRGTADTILRAAVRLRRLRLRRRLPERVGHPAWTEIWNGRLFEAGILQ